MTFKDMFAKTRSFLRHNAAARGFRPSVDSQGLIHEEPASGVGTAEAAGHDAPGRTELLRPADKPVSLDRKESIEVLGKAFNRMVDQLEGINNHLGKQVTQHEKLMDRIDELPQLLENLPNAMDNQKQLVNSLLEQLKNKTLKEQQFVEIVEKIPANISKQTDAIGDMNRKLSVSADADVQMAEGLNKFNETLGKLDTDTVSQTEGIAQMSKTFAASDRYLKYIISRQHKRFMWVFITAMSICVIAIFALVAAIVVAMNR
jgi:HAMP domain-containing protein